jgi:dTDP-4-amino-4,6-dideoxygalactose transaminase
VATGAAPGAAVLRVGHVVGLGQEGVVSSLARAVLSGRQLALAPGSVVRLAPLHRVVAALAGDLAPGVQVLASPPLPLDEVHEVILAALSPPGPDSPAPAGSAPGGAAAVSSAVPAGLAAELRRFARRFRSAAPPVFQPPLDVVVPPRPENPPLLAKRLLRIYDSGLVKYGNRWTTELEARLAELLELPADRAVLAANSGTTALRLAAAALLPGGRDRQPVAVLPSFSFAATGEFLLQLGYSLVFCDIDRSTWTLDPQALAGILRSTRVDLVVAVDALGAPADYGPLLTVCAASGVPLLADSAPALGTRYGGRPVGSQAPVHAFSLSFAKTVSAGGAGGFLVHPVEADLTAKGNWLRSAGMPEAAAAVALDQLDVLADLLSRRRVVADVYAQGLACLPQLQPQVCRTGDTHSYVHWVARVGGTADRDALGRRLRQLGVLTKPYYAPALHEVLPGRTGEPGLPVTTAVAGSVLALPMSSEMTAGEAHRVVSAVHDALARPGLAG